MNRRVWAYCLGILGAAAVLAMLAPLASTAPDGLDRVMEDHGPGRAEESAAEKPSTQPETLAGLLHPPMADYQVPGIGNKNLSTILAGLAGTLVAFALALGLGRLIRTRRAKSPPLPIRERVG
jgi:hypothetical protein